MRRLKRTAEDNFQLNRTYELLINNSGITNEDIAELAGHMHVAWEKANAEGYIEEQYDNFKDWLEGYAIAIAQDIIAKAKENEEFAKNYALLDSEDKEKLLDMTNDFVLSKSDELAAIV